MNNNRCDSLSGQIVPARTDHVDAIHTLITHYAERHQMLFRSLGSLYEQIRDFNVCVDGEGRVLGCCSLEVFWRDLAEIKSLAVDPTCHNHGIGKRLVAAALSEASRLGITRVFALTFEPSFFEKLGFRKVDKDTLPQKVWRDCIRCPTRNDCHEVPMLKELTDSELTREP